MIGYERFEFGNEEGNDEENPRKQPLSEVKKSESIRFEEKKLDYDHIEISLEDPVTAENHESNKNDTLNRASGFFLENNDNYRMSWRDVADELDKDLDLDPSNPPEKGCNKEFLRWKLRRTVESLAFRLFTMILILVDVIIVIIDLVENPGPEAKLNPYQLVDLIITVWFVIEVFLRILALTKAVFFAR